MDIAIVGETIVIEESNNLADYLIPDQPARAAMYKERYLISFLAGHIPLRQLSVGTSTRGAIGSLQARAAIEEGRQEEAIAQLQKLVAKQPSNSSILEDLYPILVTGGFKEDADKLYEKLNTYGDNALALFPNSAQDLNSNAWLKARCGKDLDTALTRSERSNELSKNNYAYLDTLAEVHFQKGDRAKAVELSEQAVKLAGSDYLLSQPTRAFQKRQTTERDTKANRTSQAPRRRRTSLPKKPPTEEPAAQEPNYRRASQPIEPAAESVSPPPASSSGRSRQAPSHSRPFNS